MPALEKEDGIAAPAQEQATYLLFPDRTTRRFPMKRLRQTGPWRRLIADAGACESMRAPRARTSETLRRRSDGLGGGSASRGPDAGQEVATVVAHSHAPGPGHAGR